jgi:hypothetical protein
MFKSIIGTIAFIVAACAAFFSVQGIASLYSDQYIAVCIMAASLEIAKLTAATFLHKYWSSTGKILKTYLSISVAILMMITSLGIYGFLTSAYQKNHAQVELSQSKQDIYKDKNNFIQKEIESLNTRINTLNEARLSQEKRLPSMSRLSAKPIYDDIERASKEILAARERVDSLSNQLIESNNSIIDLKIKDTEHRDIGTLQFVADVLNLQISQVVNWFTLIIVIVFDPLALCLVLAFSTLNKKEEQEEKEFYEDILRSSNNTNTEEQLPTEEQPLHSAQMSTDRDITNYRSKYRL